MGGLLRPWWWRIMCGVVWLERGRALGDCGMVGCIFTLSWRMVVLLLLDECMVRFIE